MGVMTNSLSRSFFPRIVALAVFAGASMSVPAETLYISKTATYADSEKVRKDVREECRPEEQLPVMMREDLMNRTAVQDVVLTDMLPADSNGMAMTMTILSLGIPHGTGWSSEKRSMKVRTALYRNGVIVSEFERYSDARGAGNFAQKVFRIRKTCDYVEHLVRDVSRNTIERFKLMKLLPDAVTATPGVE